MATASMWSTAKRSATTGQPLATDTDDNSDEIVEEIPIYLAKNVPHLAVYQFTSRKANDQLDRSRVVSSTVKPINQEARLEFALDTRSKHYDAFKGDQFAVAADGLKGISAGANSSRTFADGRMDRQAFVSSRPLENTDRFMVAVAQDGELHLTPLNGGILQMRPSFGYFDKSDVRSKAEKKAENEADLDEEEAKQVTVQFARTENENVKRAREKSFGVVSQKGADEPWCETEYFGRDTPEAALEREKLFATQLAENNNLNLTGSEYLDALIPARRRDTEYEKLMPNAIVSMDKLRLYSLSDQIQTILKDGKVIGFDLLLQLLGPEAATTNAHERVLQTLPSVGLLVQGNWTVLSEILYPTGTLSGTNGVPADLMCRARDYVLYRLSRNDPIDRPRIAAITQIPPDEVHEIVQTVATYDRKSGVWRLLADADPLFEQKYSRHKERQDLYWRAKESKYREMEAAADKMQQQKQTSNSSGSSVVAGVGASMTVVPKRKRTKSTRSDGGSGKESGGKNVDIKQEK